MKRCNTCSEEISFTRLRSGRVVPIEDPEPDEYRAWTSFATAKVALDKLQQATPPSDLRSYVQSRALVVDGELVSIWQIIVPAQDGHVRLLDGPARLTGCEQHVCSRQE